MIFFLKKSEKLRNIYPLLTRNLNNFSRENNKALNYSDPIYSRCEIHIIRSCYIMSFKQHDSAMHHSCSWLPGPAVDLLYYSISIKYEYIQNFSVAY